MIFDNPEFIRLKRGKLRPRTMVLLGAGSFLILAGILIMMYMGETQWGLVPVANMKALLERYFITVTWLQLIVVSLYGLALSAQVITLERERSTMDFQRLVGMGPYHLAAGKLFGAPIEAVFIALFGAVFAGIPVMGGAISLSIYAQSQMCIFIWAIVISAFGLMCSSLVDKTSKATGMVVIGGIVMYNVLSSVAAFGSNIFVCASPATYLLALETHANARWIKTTFDLYGLTLPIGLGYLIVNVPLIFLFFSVSARRIANEEFSFLSFRQAVSVFVVLEFIACGILFNGIGAKELRVFHGANAVMLLAFAFGLAPSGELVRSRLHRSRPNEHWKVFFELRNRLHDAPGVAATLLFCACYVVLSGVVATQIKSFSPEDIGVIIVVSCMAAAMAAALLYIQVYSEGSGFKLAFVLLLGALIVPPVFMAIGQWWDRTLYVSPFLYIVLLNDFASLTVHRPSLQGPGPMGEVWSCPGICAALAILTCMLAAMRIRYLLDMNEVAKAHEREAQRKAEAALPAGMIVARLQAQAAAPQTTALQTDNSEK